MGCARYLQREAPLNCSCLKWLLTGAAAIAIMAFLPSAASAQMPARWAANENIALLFDEQAMSGAIGEVASAYQYEVEAMMHFLTDCGRLDQLKNKTGDPFSRQVSDGCERAFIYFMNISATQLKAGKGGKTFLPGLLMALMSAPPEFSSRLSDADPAITEDQNKAQLRWYRVQSALVAAGRARLFNLAHDDSRK